MAIKTKNKTNAAATPAARQEKKKLRRGIIVLVSLAVLCAAVVFGLMRLNKLMFEDNRHFILRRIEVISSGFYGKNQANKRALIGKLDLKINSANLFELDVKKLRQTLRYQPNIADAQVAVLLPDTLQISVEERIPRAFLGRTDSPLVADANGMVMRSRECMGIHPNLPVIAGMPHHSLKAGEIHEKLRDALNLIMTVQRYRAFSVAGVNLSVPDELFVYMDYRFGSNVHRYRVTMPRGNYRENLDILQSAIEAARRRGDTHSRIEMTFDGQVVLKP